MTCMQHLFSSGEYRCPTCRASMADMSRSWALMDAEIAQTPMPAEVGVGGGVQS